ncbi:MAG TPA: STN domain-containing protein [Planctomycetota bacterium]
MLLACLLAQADPAALVERLRSDDIEARARAEADLIRLGAASEGALEAATGDADPEVASRARRILLDVVAPHRREVDQAVRHLLAHLRSQIGWDNASARVLAALLKRYFPDHPLSLKDELVQTPALTWIHQAEAAGARFTYPSREAWTRVRDDLRESVSATLRVGKTCPPCVEWRLRTVKVGLAFENAKVEDILSYLRDVGGVDLILDAMMSDEAKQLDLDRAVTLMVKDVALEEALTRVLAPYRMGYRVTEEGVVLIGLRAAE